VPERFSKKAEVQGWHLHVTSLASIVLCIGLWIRAKTVGEDERGNAERRALFVGLWPPMFWLIGDTVERRRTLRARARGRGDAGSAAFSRAADGAGRPVGPPRIRARSALC
jgi:hypothetical protein